MRGREPLNVPAAAGDAPGVGGHHHVAPGHRRRGPVDGGLWASSPSVRLMTSGRVKESQQRGRADPQGPMSAGVAGLFERDTVAPEQKGDEGTWLGFSQ